MTEETKEKIAISKLKYKKRYCQDVLQYFCESLTKRNSKGILERIPSYSEFAVKIHVSVRTLQNWKNEYEEFKEACDMCDALLQDVIVGDSLGFKMNGNFAKFLLSSRYGMKETVEVTQDKLDISPELEALIRKRRERDGE